MYEPVPLEIQPGIYKEDSATVAAGRWVDGNMVRFFRGQAERWRGWDELIAGLDLGAPARGVHSWRALDGERMIAWGTAYGLFLLYRDQLYDITPVDFVDGQVDGVAGLGWGEPGWGDGEWGGTASLTSSGGQALTWQLSNFGEDLVANARGQKIWQWDYTNGPGVVAVAVTNSPATAFGLFVEGGSRHLVTIGAENLSSDPDPLNVRWCDQEDLTTWTPASSNTAGALVVDGGNELIGSTPVDGGRLIFTDLSAHLMRFIGGQFIFAIDGVSYNSGALGPHACVSDKGVAWWMGDDQFYTYAGRVEVVPCDVHRHVFGDINRAQSHKVFCSTNRAKNEKIWFYPSASSVENDRFVAVNDEGHWSIGELARTSWLDDSVALNFPIATKPDGTILQHETGDTDENDADIDYYLTSGEVHPELSAPSAGQTHMAMRKIIPDFERISGTHELTIEARDYPMRNARSKGPYGYSAASAAFSVRTRGASFRMLFTGSGDFRMGRVKAMVTLDGNRQQ